MWAATVYPVNKRNRALTLVEAITSIFIIVSGMLVLFRLFHVAMQYGTRAEHQALASIVADKRLAEIRTWARKKTGTRYNFDVAADWTPLNTSNVPDPDDPTYRVTTSVGGGFHAVDSPCTALESVWTAPERRTMKSSLRKVQIDVSWGPAAEQKFTLVSLVGAPARQVPPPSSVPPPIELKRIAGAFPVPQDGTLTFQCTLKDIDGHLIPDVMFSEYVRSEPSFGVASGGNGILDSTNPATRRDGQTTVLLHAFPGPGRAWTYYGGRIEVDAVGRYHGVQYEDRSNRYDLQ